MTIQGKNAVDILLAESFKELVLQRPIEKITIKEITDKAGVIRPTFYNHFQDKYELLEWIIKTDLIEPMKPLIQTGLIDQALLFVFTGIEREKGFYSKACRLEGQNSFESIVMTCIKETLLEVLEIHNKSKEVIKWLTPDVLTSYYAESMSFMIISWIRTGMKATPQEITDIYRYLADKSFEEVLGTVSENENLGL